MPTLGNAAIAVAAVSAFFLLVAAIAYFVAAKRRAEIDAALRGGRSVKRLGMFDLARSDVMTIQHNRYLTIPEKLWTYDNFYLEKFATAARQVRLPDGVIALYAYIGVLKLDLVFAAAFGLFVALLEFDVATVLLPRWPLCAGAVMFCAAMAVVYGAADVAEDLKLMSILKDWRTATSGRSVARVDRGDDSSVEEPYIDGGEAAAANALTRIKFVTVVLFVPGGPMFAVFYWLAETISRQRNSSTTSSPPTVTPSPSAG